MVCISGGWGVTVLVWVGVIALAVLLFVAAWKTAFSPATSQTWAKIPAIVTGVIAVSLVFSLIVPLFKWVPPISVGTPPALQ